MTPFDESKMLHGKWYVMSFWLGNCMQKMCYEVVEKYAVVLFTSKLDQSLSSLVLLYESLVSCQTIFQMISFKYSSVQH